MTKRGYHHVIEGEWLRITKRGFREQCCDCGLTHRTNFKIDEQGRLWAQTYRDGKATGGARKNFKFTKDEQ
jgi:hypothetical protein